MRPSSGTGHSTRPVTSSSRPGIVDHGQAARGGQPRRCPSAITPPALGGIDDARGARAASSAQSAPRHGERAGGEEAMALGQVAGGQPVPVIVAVAQVERHHRAVEQAEDAAQRADPGEVAGAAPAHRLRPGEAAQQRRAARRRSAPRRRRPARLLQHPELAFLAQLLARGAVLAQEAGQRLLRRAERAGRARCCALAATAAATSARQRDAARAVEGRACRRAPAAPAPRRPAGPDPRPRGPACAPGSPR